MVVVEAVAFSTCLSATSPLAVPVQLLTSAVKARHDAPSRTRTGVTSFLRGIAARVVASGARHAASALLAAASALLVAASALLAAASALHDAQIGYLGQTVG